MVRSKLMLKCVIFWRKFLKNDGVLFGLEDVWVKTGKKCVKSDVLSREKRMFWRL